jgi:hypothetical protein
LNDYINANQPSTSLAQNKPSYTNLSGGALGVFTARNKIEYVRPFITNTGINGRGFGQNSTRELCLGQYTLSLGFCSSHENDETINGVLSGFYCN